MLFVSDQEMGHKQTRLGPTILTVHSVISLSSDLFPKKQCQLDNYRDTPVMSLAFLYNQIALVTKIMARFA